MQQDSLVENTAEITSIILRELMADVGLGKQSSCCSSSCLAVLNCSSFVQKSLLGCCFLKFVRTFLRSATTHGPYVFGLFESVFSLYSWRIDERMC